jgi:multicomponent K+:H+ antiporter subunit D
VPEGVVIVLWSVVLGTSLLNLLALARAGSRLFWQTPTVATARNAAPQPPSPALGERVAMLMLVFGLIVTTVMASDLTRYVAGSAAQLSEPAMYREAVLGRDPLPTTVPR